MQLGCIAEKKGLGFFVTLIFSKVAFSEIRRDKWNYSQELFGNCQIWFESMMALRQGFLIASLIRGMVEEKKRFNRIRINELFQNCFWLINKRKKVGHTYSTHINYMYLVSESDGCL